ncbi:interleukin-21 receptor [Scophthalmus maximus]|uniref:interleukin-21 receptor n=1 Tax=Scophthalmus maximus TaxID=52904 RepID=UPI0015E0834E|nr:interleukin-21 receptor [Scophthalmus maximus]XP_035464602.1 interleukin-21 receptor [Scophthalmus maximus]
MKCLQLLFVCWCSSVLDATSCIRVDGYSCVSAYWKTVTCDLNITDSPVGRSNTTYSLKFTELRKGTISICPLVFKNHSYSCDCKVLSSISFSVYNMYTIQLCHDSGCCTLLKTFSPAQNIQLTPPYEVEFRQMAEVLNITWKSGYEVHPYFYSDLDYELVLQKSHSSESKKATSRWTSTSFTREQIDTRATYCTQVRSIPHAKDYSAVWSKWGPKTCWNGAQEDAFSEQENIFITLTKSLGPVCVVVGVLLFVFQSPAARMKIKTLSHAPSPAPFFQPLFQKHEGNLQEWLSPQGKFALTYQTEEILITEAVTVEPKPITKDPEENQDYHNPSVTQMLFTQTSYVGLPGTHEASQPITMVCPAGTSYTQLPCSVWGLSIGEVQVVSSASQDEDVWDASESSHADSGCSCHDLTQSPECSLPNSPVGDSLPPCYCSDYCILNKTAGGVVPVLVSK